MKPIGLIIVVAFASTSAEAVNLNQLMKQKIQEAAKKASPPPAPAPVPAAVPAPAPVAPSAPSDPSEEFIKKTWASVPQAKSTCFNAGETISKNIQDSSGRVLYCYLSSLISFEQLQKLAGVSIFVSGPHKNKLEFNSTKSFGYYNKEFVNWIWNKVVPVVTEPSFVAANQEIYNTYLKTTLLKLHSALSFAYTNNLLKTMADAYQKQLSSPQGVESAFNTFYPLMANYPNPLGCTPEAVGFWVRRTIDGTVESLMYSLLAVNTAYAKEDLKKLTAQIKAGRSKK